MMIFLAVGALFLFFSLLFFFAPRLIIKISEIGNKLLFTDDRSVAHRYWSGLILLLMSLVMFYLGLHV